MIRACWGLLPQWGGDGVVEAVVTEGDGGGRCRRLWW